MGTPNVEFGGPGIGKGGGRGSSISNSESLGNLLIISDPSSPVGEPGDDRSGGTLDFEFSHPVDVFQVSLVDVGDWPAEYGIMSLLRGISHPERSISMFLPKMPNNGAQRMSFDRIEGVQSLSILIPRSGAVSSVGYCIYNEAMLAPTPKCRVGCPVPTDSPTEYPTESPTKTAPPSAPSDIIV